MFMLWRKIKIELLSNLSGQIFILIMIFLNENSFIRAILCKQQKLINISESNELNVRVKYNKNSLPFFIRDVKF